LLLPVESVVLSLMVVGLKIYERHKFAQHRRATILIEALNQTRSRYRPRSHASAGVREMESLLGDIRNSADALVCALSMEEEAKRIASQVHDPKDVSPIAHLRMAREHSEKAQGDYYHCVESYRQFVQSLAPPLRAKAEERGRDVMMLAWA